MDAQQTASRSSLGIAIVGLGGAVVLYAVMLTTFHFFIG